MLSRLIITFLCAAAIGSVSGAFLTFGTDQLIVRDIEGTIGFSVKLNSKPTEEVTVYIEHPSMSMSTCAMIFRPENWDVPQEIIGISAPLFVGSSNPPEELPAISKILARAVTVGSLSAELSSTDTLEVIQENLGSSLCSIRGSIPLTFDSMHIFLEKPGWYQMLHTRDITVQVFMDKCVSELQCVKTVLVRYGSSVMSMNVNGPVKDVSEYSVTKVTSRTNGLQYTPGPRVGVHTITFSYGSVLTIEVVKNNGIVSLNMGLILVGGYPLSRGFCNIPRPDSPGNRLIGSDGKSYSHEKKEEAVAFAKSWGIKDEDALTNPGARRLILPIRHPTTMCKFPTDPPPKPVVPVSPPPTTATTTSSSTTMDFSTYVSSFTVDLSESTLSPTITYVVSSTTITTSPSTTSTTSPYLPDPPAPGGYVRPPPPKPGVVDEIQKCLKPARI
ncbi:hypothetical protein BASA50_001509 [Batrachochytrium salamandrivorans]|uniref:VWFD domain-containing protein n=1 Tax=Batrachochytrium salamandrivorans TaxID=1357716 RepID=A0ABQ8FQ53_9FUNG|nr:hypothetical protein BASA60_001292 [Batrachochytrium salamandrivorans]KAH6601561.1 hypothetical protein BASA50_001509 [Batrachochytrium salamandrivorans]KAH9250303.1 hypothetical protein BASA81_011920 [Batrachochytrium salamandrivorans]